MRCENLLWRGHTFDFFDFRLEISAFLLIANFNAAPESLTRAHYSGSVHLRCFLIDYILDLLQRLWIFLTDSAFRIPSNPKNEGTKVWIIRTSATHSIRDLSERNQSTNEQNEG